VTHLIEEVQDRNDPTAESSAGYRIGFWKMSVTAIREAPVIGHGTGAMTEAFRRQGSDSAVNPHNQIFAVGIQLGIVGIVVLIAMWAAHWRLFFVSSQASWFGLVVVTQNIVSSLFNSHLSDFTQGWIYVFGVGVLAGMVLRCIPTRTPAGARSCDATAAP
jgi:O-antigen ligase